MNDEEREWLERLEQRKIDEKKKWHEWVEFEQQKAQSGEDVSNPPKKEKE